MLTKKINNIIDKIPMFVGMITLYLSLCFSSAYDSQDMVMMAVINTQELLAISEVMGWWYYFFGGLVYWGIFELVMRLFVRIVWAQLPMLDRKQIYHYTRIIFTINNLVIGAFNLIYFFVPLAITFGKIIVAFIVNSLFLYLLYYLVSRKNLPNFLWGRALKSVASIYFTYQILTVVINLYLMIRGAL